MTFIATTVAAMVTALQSAPAVSANVHRSRLRPLAQGTSSALVVRPLSADVAQATFTPAGMPVSWTSAIAVECYARSTAGTAPDQAVDALLEAAYTRLMADPTLGGAVIAMAPKEMAYDFDADGEQTTCATLVFTVRHRANGATLN